MGFAGLVLRAAVAVGAGTQRSATASHPEGRHPPSVPTRGVGRVGASQNQTPESAVHIPAGKRQQEQECADPRNRQPPGRGTAQVASFLD